MKPIYILTETVTIAKTGIFTITFHKPVGEENPFVQFRYIPMKICNHTQGQLSGSIEAYPINMIHTSQQSTKEVLNEEFEGDNNLYRFNCSLINQE